MKNTPYDWNNFPIGQTRCIAHRYRQAVVTSFKNFVKARGLDWVCTTKSDPPSPKKGERCNMVWITRIDPKKPKPGLSMGEADAPGFEGPACLKLDGKEFEAPLHDPKGRLVHKRPVVIDIRDIPVHMRLEALESRKGKTRLTRAGWDRMQVGEYEITKARLVDITHQIRTSCLARGLAWRFEIRRVQNPDDKEDRSAWHLVSRLR